MCGRQIGTYSRQCLHVARLTRQQLLLQSEGVKVHVMTAATYEQPR